MLLVAEHLAVVGADALEDAVAVEQPVVVDADLGLGLVHELAVHFGSGLGLFPFRIGQEFFPRFVASFSARIGAPSSWEATLPDFSSPT